MSRGPPTVLPSFADLSVAGEPREQLPIAPLLHAAAAIGHAQLEVDPDGIVRSVFLREGPRAADRPYLAAALLQSLPGAAPPRLIGERHPDVSPSQTAWIRDYRMLIPFLGPPGHFAQLSYVDVLRGAADTARLRGKIVLVGLAAQGMSDAFPTPRSGHSRPMPGVEITANVLQALRTGTTIREVPKPVAILLALVPIALAALGLRYLAPRQSLLFVFTLWLLTLAAAVGALRVGGLWWPPAASLAALLLVYPLWSWRRLEATQTYLEEEFARLANERFPLLADPAAVPPQTRSPDFLQRRIELLRRATQRLRNARRLLADTVNSLPDATLLSDVGGRVVLANPAAHALFERADGTTLEGAWIDDLLFRRIGALNLQFVALSAAAPCTIEASLSDVGRHLLVRAMPFHDGSAKRVGTIIDLADITELRAVQREREDVMRFLSHDMKSPAASLLGLAQLQRDPARALPPQELSQRLDLLAQRMLTLLDSFVALARAEATDPGTFENFDLRDAVQDAYDEVWAAAQARRIVIRVSVPDEPCSVDGDRQQLARAIVNLLGNAIKFAPAGTTVDLSCERREADIVVSVADEGPGIAPEHRRTLFQRFSRGQHHGSVDPGGAGLGLAFVRVVADKHRGRAWADHRANTRTAFLLAIPAAASN